MALYTHDIATFIYIEEIFRCLDDEMCFHHFLLVGFQVIILHSIIRNIFYGILTRIVYYVSSCAAQHSAKINVEKSSKCK